MTVITDTTNTIHTLPFVKSSIKKIAVFRALQLGDMLCIIPVVRAIKNVYGDASITLIGLSGQRHFVHRFKNYFDDFIEFPGWPGLPEQTVEPAKVSEFLCDVQQRKFDLVLQMQGNGNFVNPMCMLFGARFVAGLRREEDTWLNNPLFPELNEREHEVLRFFRIANAIGVHSNHLALEFPVIESEMAIANQIKETLNLENNKYVCIHPGARDPKRRWAPEGFAAVADAVIERGYKVLLTGSLEEKELLEEVASLMKHDSINLVEHAGHIGIGELAGLIQYAAGIISNDTGVSHVASALHVRSVVIFSPYSEPHRWAPLNKHLHSVIPVEESYNVQHVLQVVLKHFQPMETPLRHQYIW